MRWQSTSVTGADDSSSHQVHPSRRARTPTPTRRGGGRLQSGSPRRSRSGELGRERSACPQRKWQGPLCERGTSPTDVAVGDVDGDVIDDVAVANMGSNDVSLFLGGRSGVRPAGGSPLSTGTAPAAIALADLNGDGRADIVTGNSGSRDVSVRLSPQSDGSRADQRHRVVGASPIKDLEVLLLEGHDGEKELLELEPNSFVEIEHCSQ